MHSKLRWYMNSINNFLVLELHLFLGCTNRIFDHLEDEMKILKEKNKVLKTAYQWAHEAPRNVVQEKYWGRKLNGEMSNRLLSYSEDLTNWLPEDLKRFGEALTLLNKVKKSCFGMDLLPSWEFDLERFIEKYESLELGYTPKIHALKVHVKQFITLTGHSLGRYTEQPFEAIHKDFKNVWINYKRTRNNKTYPTQLCNCVVAYNSNNL